jgi:hypothetical protein
MGIPADATHLVDLDGDGHLDLAAVGNPVIGNARLVVRLGAGDGSFGSRREYEAGGGPRFIRSADLNEDGHLDLVVVNASDDLWVSLGDGHGSLAPAQRFPAGDSPYSVAIGDLNEDGNLDAVVGNFLQQVSILLGDGTGSLGPPSGFTAGTRPWWVGLADFNADGHLDLVVADQWTDQVSIRMGAGNGTFGSATTYATSLDPVAVFVANLNGDTFPDVIVDAASAVSIHLGTAGGLLATPTHLTASGQLALGQFAGGAATDLLVLNGKVASVFPGTGAGTFLAAITTSLPFGGSSRIPEAGDLDEDGVADFVVSANNWIGVFPGNGDGTFPRPTQIPKFAGSLAAGPFDGDAAVDLILAASDNVYFVKGNGDGSFQTPSVVPSSSSPNFVMAGDINGDGKLDIVAVRALIEVSVYLGNGAGAFTFTGNSAVGPGAIRAAMGDFDGDGKQDLVVTNQNSDDISLLRGHGNGTFDPEVRLPVGIIPSGVGVSDLNGDSAPDIAVANWNPDVLSLYFGNGDGTFQAEYQLPSLITRHQPLAVDDFNADGNGDIAVGGQPWRIEAFLGRGDGTFEPPEFLFTPNPGGFVADFTVGDVNGDDIPDLVSADDNNHTVSVFAGIGNGAFVHDVSALAEEFAYVVIAADFNGDGADDLAVASESVAKVTILLSQAPVGGPCLDADGDGSGLPGNGACSGGALPDCNDSNAALFPAALDGCDGIDQSCDGMDGVDLDADGYATCTGDCNDGDYGIHPNRTEYCNGIDEDCDGSIDHPGEVATSLAFPAAGNTFTWSVASPSTSSYNVYRGSLGPGAFGFNHACFAPAVAAPQATDSQTISTPGTGFYYLVSGRNSCGEGTVGFSSNAQERPNLLPCP